MADTNLAVAQQVQSRNHFYLLGLVFTVLALAVETANSKGPLAASVAELLGWLLLLTSGVLGIFRFESVPRLYQLFDAQQKLTTERSRLAQAVAAGFDVVYDEQRAREGPISDYASSVEKDVELARRTVKELNASLNKRYIMHRWLFLAGVACLMVSRGWWGIAQIVAALTKPSV